MTLRFVIALAMIAAAIGASRHLSHGELVPPARSFSSFPLELQEWRWKEQYFAPEIYEKLGVTDSIVRAYLAPDGPPVSVYVGYYRSQRRGAQIHSPKYCLPGGGWNRREERVRQIQVPSVGKPIHAVEAVYEKDGEKELFVYWYQSRGRTMASEYDQKLQMMLGAIRENRTDAAFIRFSTPVPGGDVAAASKRMEGFLASFVPILGEYLPG